MRQDNKQEREIPEEALRRSRRSRLVLGAYGCGVFRNDPEDVARFWQELLIDEGWGRLFERVAFSILERPGRDGNTAPFRRRFG